MIKCHLIEERRRGGKRRRGEEEGRGGEEEGRESETWQINSYKDQDKHTCGKCTRYIQT